MKYDLFILRRGQKELAILPRLDYERVKEAVSNLGNNPRPHGCSKLIAREGWRIRVGNYRIIYEINDTTKEITILHIGHRRDVYK
jgi:mRNA interferase RelE/StbE